MTDQTLPTPRMEVSGSNRLRVLLTGIGALVALAGLYVLVISPLLGEDPSALGLPPDDSLVSDVPSVDDPTAGSEAAPPQVTSEVFAPRDPFQQLVTLSGPGTVASAGAIATETIPATATTSTTGSGETSEPQTTGLPATRVDSTVVKLVTITDHEGVAQATVTVDGVEHTAAEGAQFATSFRVLDITGDCATLVFGDRRFTLCAGEEIRK